MSDTIISLDVAFRRLGYIVFDLALKPIVCGVIETKPSAKKQKVRVADDNARRSAAIAAELESLIKTHSVKLILAELPSGGAKSSRAIVQMGMASTVVAVVSELLKIPAVWCTPSEAKEALVGHRKASKDEMISRARLEVKGVTLPTSNAYCEHIADAYGVMKALRHDNMVRMLQSNSVNQVSKPSFRRDL
jgi:Holliday junction resolvasome RuvABC endonuclease subunit